MDKQDVTAGIKRLLGSSKAIVVLVAILGVILMEVLGRIDGTHALDTIKWLVAALIGATAAEDAASKLGLGSKRDGE